MMAHLLLLACTPAIKAPVHGGEPVLARAHFITADGTVLPLRAWWPVSDPVKGIVVALHGFNDYGRAFTQPGKYLSRRGIALVAYDQRGFGHAPGRGLWAGTESYIADLDAVVSQLRRSHPGVPVFVLGENGIQHRVRNLVGDFVGMAFGHRLGSEQEIAHGLGRLVRVEG